MTGCQGSMRLRWDPKPVLHHLQCSKAARIERAVRSRPPDLVSSLRSSPRPPKPQQPLAEVTTPKLWDNFCGVLFGDPSHNPNCCKKRHLHLLCWTHQPRNRSSLALMRTQAESSTKKLNKHLLSHMFKNISILVYIYIYIHIYIHIYVQYMFNVFFLMLNFKNSIFHLRSTGAFLVSFQHSRRSTRRFIMTWGRKKQKNSLSKHRAY